MAYKIQGECCCQDKCCDKQKKDIEIKAGTCIDIDKSVEGEYTINSLAETTVESTDGSVHVSLKNGSTPCKKMYDISVDCDDRKVGVCDEDTPGFLKDKITGISPIYTEPICTSNGVVQIGIDQSKLDIKDEKVAVTQGCESKYLVNAIDVRSQYVEAVLDTDRCVLVIKDKEMAPKPLIKVRLQSTSQTSQIVDHSGSPYVDHDYVLVKNPSAYGDIDGITSTYNIEFSIGEAIGPGIINGLDSATGFCVAPMDGIYRITYGGTLEVSSGVIAWRTYLFHLIGGVSRVVCMETRSGGGHGYVSGVPAGESWYEDFAVAHFYDVETMTHRLQSIGKYIPRQSFSGDTLLRVRKGDMFGLGVRICTALDDEAYDYNRPAYFQIQDATHQGPGGADEGAYFTLEYLCPLPA